MAARARKEESAGSLVVQVGILLTLGVLVLMVLYLRRADSEWLPAFPQSFFPIHGSLYLFIPLPYLLRFVRIPFGGFGSDAAMLALILVLSWLGFHLFSSRARLAANLPETDETLDDVAAGLRRQTSFATVVLTAGTAAELAWRHFWPSSLLLSFVEVVATAAIALDLWDQFRFQRREGATALLVQLDNVHFSYRLEERLQEEGVEALARGHQFRSLYFFLGPLFKIDVLVPREKLDRAQQVLAELEVASEVKVF